MRYMARLAVLVCTLLCGCFVGCGSPTKTFESFVAKAESALKADSELQKDHTFFPVKYDVQQTDSTVSPLVAEIVVTGINVPALAAKQLRVQGDVGPASVVVANKIKVDEARAKQLVEDAKRRAGPKASVGNTPEERRFARLVEDASDDGERTYRFKYAYQDKRWLLKAAESEAVDKMEMLKGVPEQIQKYFTP
jgi:hypothetical protein